MLTLLLYVLIVGLVAVVLFLLASAVFGRGEELGPLPEGTTTTVLPAEGITGADVRSLRFQQVVRGYKAGEVDWALARLAARIDELQTELAHTRARHAPAAAKHPLPDAPPPPAAYSFEAGPAQPRDHQ
ncbi:DivIVA domain-containing protein [Nocardia sp. NPDC050712]|uniref:DivIVA domain-containing protein n=1 Tax=Nocardia sp. NPDC050712 TaxID=3155518 RepID=UPI0034055116